MDSKCPVCGLEPHDDYRPWQCDRPPKWPNWKRPVWTLRVWWGFWLVYGVGGFIDGIYNDPTFRPLTDNPAIVTFILGIGATLLTLHLLHKL